MQQNYRETNKKGESKGSLINNLQLYATDKCPEEAHHAQEFDSAQVLHCVLLAHVGYSIKNSTEQDQPVAQHNITGCTQKKRDNYKCAIISIINLYSNFQERNTLCFPREDNL